MSNRDEFINTSKGIIAQRAGYRCSNPTCRRGTYMPNPANSMTAMNQGVAAHIKAASPGGPRYDTTMSPEQRKSPDNGIWLCQWCAKVIDAAPDAYPVETLLAWKNHAEIAASRDARLTTDVTGDLMTLIDLARSSIAYFVAEWKGKEPLWKSHTPETWHAYVNEILSRSNATNIAYHAEIVPQTAAIITRCEIILGAENEYVVRAKEGAQAQATNFLTMLAMAESLQALKTSLQLR